MTSNSNTGSTSTAVWYFVGATFIFIAPIILLPDSPLWVSIVSFALGLLVMVLGGIQLGRELKRRRQRPHPPEDDPRHPR